MKKEVVHKIYHAALVAVRLRVTDAFNQTRSIVPVRTGRLKSSGSNEILNNGSETIFKAPYASFVERGVRPGVRNVRSYYRKDGSFVKAHSYFHPGQKAQKYIEKPLTESMAKLNEEFDTQLRNEGFKVKKS
jgi:hypothetical protein